MDRPRASLRLSDQATEDACFERRQLDQRRRRDRCCFRFVHMRVRGSGLAIAWAGSRGTSSRCGSFACTRPATGACAPMADGARYAAAAQAEYAGAGMKAVAPYRLTRTENRFAGIRSRSLLPRLSATCHSTASPACRGTSAAVAAGQERRASAANSTAECARRRISP